MPQEARCHNDVNDDLCIRSRFEWDVFTIYDLSAIINAYDVNA